MTDAREGEGKMDKKVDSIKEVDLNAYEMPAIVVYDHPSDYPDNYVAILFEDAEATEIVIIKDDVDEIQQDIRENTDMMFFPRRTEDRPYIVGIWM